MGHYLSFPDNNEIVICALFMCQSRLRRELLLPESLKHQSNPFILINNHENHIPEIHKNAINYLNKSAYFLQK